jgi:hypothetical protein
MAKGEFGNKKIKRTVPHDAVIEPQTEEVTGFPPCHFVTFASILFSFCILFDM